MGFRLFSSSFSTNESDCPVQIGESFSTSAGRYCHHVKPRFPCFIKVWLSRLPRSNVISLNRMVEEGRSREADGCQALILWPVPIIPASLEAKGLRGFISPLTSDDWKLLQKFPQPSSQKKKEKTRHSSGPRLAVMGCDSLNVRNETSNQQFANLTVERLCCFSIPRAFQSRLTIETSRTWKPVLTTSQIKPPPLFAVIVSLRLGHCNVNYECKHGCLFCE